MLLPGPNHSAAQGCRRPHPRLDPHQNTGALRNPIRTTMGLRQDQTLFSLLRNLRRDAVDFVGGATYGGNHGPAQCIVTGLKRRAGTFSKKGGERCRS